MAVGSLNANGCVYINIRNSLVKTTLLFNVNAQKGTSSSRIFGAEVYRYFKTKGNPVVSTSMTSFAKL